MTLAIMVHGGAKPIAQEDIQAHKEGCLRAVQVGWEVLKSGGSALDAVEAAVRVLEDDPTFNAGFGSELNAAGEAEMDAAIMDGADLRAGGIGAVKGVRHPITLARMVLEDEPVLLVAASAQSYAAEHGAELCHPDEMITSQQRKKWKQKQNQPSTPPEQEHGTVGCVALDGNGNVAAGTSTGGTGKNQPGRIGDSPLVGCGLFADDQLGACSTTGDGESIIRVVLAKTAVDRLAGGRHPSEAADSAIQFFQLRVPGEAGCILLDSSGRIGWAHNAANMACGYQTSGMEAPAAFVRRDEDTARDEGDGR